MVGDFGTGVVKPQLVIERNAEGNINLGHEHDTKDSKKIYFLFNAQIMLTYVIHI